MDGIAAFERNTIDLISLLARCLPGLRHWREEGLVITLAGWSAAVQFNGVLVLDQQIITPQRLAALETIFAEEALPFGIEICCRTPIPTCDSTLRDCGYSLTLSEPIMICRGALTVPPLNPAVQIKAINGLADREHYKRIMVESFNISAGVSQEIFDVMLSLTESQQYIAWLHDEPVGTGMLFNLSGTASIYNVATLPNARRQGVATAMMATLHAQALASGNEGTVLVVQSDAGLALYKRLGYQQEGYHCIYERSIQPPTPADTPAI
ncbi:MAG: GNAT family N-acetyltransferase [Chloroflexota bacterium]